ncbi:PTS sugar transporter subunit IIA [Halosimplex aquaticum]|uniref:PTS sugar transporter subunit IIA n=1 Tax=Halosimplex aquaticum TaxID=3026162 RepID=A0ABD5Y206_9EURY|nr:PTS sugar transporter subunit IIA [Halosimplex aquaticum]
MQSNVIQSSFVSLTPAVDGRWDCIEHLVDLVADAGRVTDRERAITALRDRAAESPFGVGLGVAVPHARTAAVREPTVAVASLANGLDFGGPDGTPARLVVLLLAPDGADEAHLSLLSAVSRGLVDEDVRDRLLTADDESAVVDAVQTVIDA